MNLTNKKNTINNIKFGLIITCLIITMIGQGCANIGTIEGGPRDTTPPRLDSLRSTRNFQTQFQKQDITLTFDEWIKFDNPSQVVVSPPLEFKPTMQLKGKTLRLQFDEKEQLRTNATYTINFGESLKDLTEGNVTKVRFVYSTGNAIDSLKADFKVYDALRGTPIENALVLLYDQFQDSIVTKSRPFYFGKTDKEGNCTIENLRQGQFKVFALLDGNLNYKYDLPNEKIGFVTDPITVGKDSIKALNISFFEPQVPIRIKEKKITPYGKIRFNLTQNVRKLTPTWTNITQKVAIEQGGDSLIVWYHQPDVKAAWSLFLLRDTIAIKANSGLDFLAKATLRLANQLPLRRGADSLPLSVETIPMGKMFDILFNQPIDAIDTTLIRCVDDSTKQQIAKLSFQKDTLNPRLLHLRALWLEGRTYQITGLPNAFTDIFGLKNDTIVLKVKVAPKKEYGDIVLNYKGLDVQKQYIVQLLEGERVIEERIITKKIQGIMNFETLPINKYQLRLITDSNRNGQWDSGNYYEHRLPESVFYKSIDDLKPNWIVETEWEIK